MSGLAKPTNHTTAVDSLRTLLERAKPKFEDVIPKHLSTDRLVRVAIAACSRTPKLLECSQISVLNAVMQAAQLGLEPGGPLGSAYLVPYKTTCTLIVGYRGLIDLARRSGQIASIEAHAVYQKDRFICRMGLAPVLEHEPHWGPDPGELVAVYAIAQLKGGGTQFEVMTAAQVEKIRQRSPASRSNESPWSNKDDYPEMARKTVVRRLCKYLPLSTEMAEALDLDERADFGEQQEMIDLPGEPPPKPATKTEAIKAKLRAGKNGAAAEPELKPDATSAEALDAEYEAEHAEEGETGTLEGI